MLPIAVLPAAGLLLGIGGALSNPNTLAAYPFLDVGWLQAIFTIMSSAGSIVFANLSVLFAVGVAVGLAKSDKGTAGLAALTRVSGDECHHQRAADPHRQTGA
jgi:PTS system maltose and glucose-specific IIC component